MHEKFQALVLAAGKSSRFKTERTKLSYTICGQEIILAVVKALQECALPITLIVGYQKELVQKIISEKFSDPVHYIEQHEQKGTGHAIWCSRQTWNAEHIVILNGDMPLVTASVINNLMVQHLNENADISLASAQCPETHHRYGRILKTDGYLSIIEARDFTGDIEQHHPINAGIYIIKKAVLEYFLPLIVEQPSGEIYLTDVINLASRSGNKIVIQNVNYDMVHGVNTLEELAHVEYKKKMQIIEQCMQEGVRFLAPETVYIESNISIGSDTVIEPGVCLFGGTTIGKHCRIGAHSYLKNVVLHDDIKVLPYSFLCDAEIQSGAQIGPFAHVRNNSKVGQEAVIGNFVEVSQSTIGAKTKAKHLSYLGNATIGASVNIGAGTITCNYNGFIKQQTIIHDQASIGAANTLIAPVTIGQSAMTGAHSCITQSIPEQALAIARAHQVNKEDGAALYRAKQQMNMINFKAAVADDMLEK